MSQQSAMFNLNDFSKEAEAILDSAKRQADEMLANAKSEIEATKEAAKKSGYEKGYEDGKAEGHKKGVEQGHAEAVKALKEETKNIQGILTQLTKHLNQQRNDLLHKAETELLELSYAIAKKVIKAELLSNKDVIKENVLNAIRYVSEKNEISIHLNENDLSVIEKYLTEWKQTINDLEKIHLVKNDKMTQGGCIVSSKAGDVDLTIEKQLKKISLLLLQKELSTNLEEVEIPEEKVVSSEGETTTDELDENGN